MTNMIPQSQLTKMSLDELATLGTDIMNQSVFMLGHVLNEARSRFPDNEEFGEWRCTNFVQLHRNTALNLMQLVKVFPDTKALGKRGQSIGYEIAAPINDDIRDTLIKQTADGASVKEVKTMIAALRQPPPAPDDTPAPAPAPAPAPDAPVTLTTLAMEFTPDSEGEAALQSLVLGQTPKQTGGHLARAQLIMKYPELVAQVFKQTMTLSKAESRAKALKDGSMPDAPIPIATEAFIKKMYRLLPAKLRKDMESRDIPHPADVALRQSTGAMRQHMANLKASEEKTVMLAIAQARSHQAVVFEYLLNEYLAKNLEKELRAVNARHMQLDLKERKLIDGELTIPPSELAGGWTKTEVKKLRSALHPDKTGSADLFQIFKRVIK